MNWQEIILNSPLALNAEMNGAEFVLGDPAARDNIDQLASELEIKLPEEFYNLYMEVDGAGMAESETDICWFLLPIERIREATQDLHGSHFSDSESEQKAKRMVCFGDWFDGNCFGYLADDYLVVTSLEIYEYDHGEGKIEPWGRTLKDFLCLEVGE